MPSGSAKRTLRGRPEYPQAWSLEPIIRIMAINLPFTCTQVRHELGEYFAFIFNSFGAMTVSDVSPMLSAFTTGQRNKIEVITTNYMHKGGTRLFDDVVLSMLPNLKRLVLRDLSAMDDRGKEQTLQAFQNSSKNEKAWIEILDIC
jgi:hypothetical protein